MWLSTLSISPTAGILPTLLVATLLLSSCATLSKEECVVGNWQSIGYNDGVAGYSSERLAAHSKACAKVNVAPDYQAWERGRKLGLQQYCTVNNAYNIGLQGRDLNNVCPTSTVNSLREANRQGRQYYTLSSEITKDRQRSVEYRTEYDKLLNGDMLDFKTEKQARERLIHLQLELQKIRHRVDNNTKQLALLDQLNIY